LGHPGIATFKAIIYDHRFDLGVLCFVAVLTIDPPKNQINQIK